MSNLLRISEAVSLAIHTMAVLARAPEKRLRTAELAAALNGASVNTLSKTLQRLSKARLVCSVSGPSGGYVLNAPPEMITLLAIYEAVEGPIGQAECLLGQVNPCSGEQCVFGGLVQSVHSQVRDHLANTTLDKLV